MFSVNSLDSVLILTKTQHSENQFFRGAFQIKFILTSSWSTLRRRAGRTRSTDSTKSVSTTDY